MDKSTSEFNTDPISRKLKKFTVVLFLLSFFCTGPGCFRGSNLPPVTTRPSVQGLVMFSGDAALPPEPENILSETILGFREFSAVNVTVERTDPDFSKFRGSENNIFFVVFVSGGNQSWKHNPRIPGIFELPVLESEYRARLVVYSGGEVHEKNNIKGKAVLRTGLRVTPTGPIGSFYYPGESVFSGLRSKAFRDLGNKIGKSVVKFINQEESSAPPSSGD